MSALSDSDLVGQALAGRKQAYAELVRRWAPRITAFCHSKTARAAVAEDLAQETLLRGYRFLSSIQEPEKFGTWLCGIARRVCLDWLKAKERTQLNFVDLSAEKNPEEFWQGAETSQIDVLEQSDERKQLMGFVEALPENLREVLMLFYYQEMKYQEIAELLGVSYATVNARLTQARALLRIKMSPKES